MGRLPWSSNETYLGTVRDGDRVLLVVYKPRAGERPLWDFPEGTLADREAAAYAVSDALGWRLVPETVVRDGPFGPGAVQRYIPNDPQVHYLAIRGADLKRAMQIAAFDVVTNNADRKSGHVVVDEAGQLWAIDHGLTFSRAPKLRTVIWDFAGQPVPDHLRSDLERLAGNLEAGMPLAASLAGHLAVREVDALAARARRLARHGRFPGTDPDTRDIPWPPV
jgi:hypothetical protein